MTFLGLAILNLATNERNHSLLRKSSFTRLLRDLLSLLSLLLDIGKTHSSNSLLDLEQLSSTALALLSSLF